MQSARRVLHSANDSDYTRTYIGDLIDVGAHFVRLGAGAGGKAARDSGWNVNPLDQATVLGLIDAGALIGLIPGSVGLIAVDVDGEDHAAPEFGEVESAGVAWAHALGSREHGRVTTRSGGAHLLWRVDGASEVGNCRWRVDSEGERVAGGEIRAGKGYAVIWDLDAIADVALSNDLSPVKWRWRGNGWVRKMHRDLSRASRAAAWIRSSESRHDRLVAGVASDAKAGALTDASAWHDASERMGWNTGAGRIIERGEIDKAWSSGVVAVGGLTRFDAYRKPSAQASEQAQIEHADQHIDQRTSAQIEHGEDGDHDDGDDGADRRWCEITHDASGSERVAQAMALIDGRVDWFDGALRVCDGLTWRDGDKGDLIGALHESGVCGSCLHATAMAVLLRLKDAGRDIESALPVPMLIAGDPMVLRGSAVIDGGLEKLEPRALTAADRCILAPRAPGIPMLIVAKRISTIEREIIIDCWGLGECCADRLMQWLARAYRESQRQVPVLLADTDAGKSTLIDAITRVMPKGAAMVVQGEDVDRYYASRIMTSALVIADEAQDLDTGAFKTLKGRTGGGHGGMRGIRQVGGSRASRASMMLAAERELIRFGSQWRGGWLNRARVYLQRRNGVISPNRRRELLMPDSLGEFEARIIGSDNDDWFEHCEHTSESRRAVESAMRRRSKGFVIKGGATVMDDGAAQAIEHDQQAQIEQGALRNG